MARGWRLPERPSRVARRVLARVDGELVTQAFEPAWEELRATMIVTTRRGVLARAWRRLRFEVQTILLALACVRLQREHEGGRRRKGRSIMNRWLRDVVYGVRALRRRPVFTLVATLTLALGIGATTAIFSVVNAVLLRPLPFPLSSRLVTMDIMGPQGYPVSLSLPNHQDWRERSRALETLAGYAGWNMRRQMDAGVDIVRAHIIIGDFFETLGVAPLLGRWIAAAETEPGAAPVVVLSHGLWQRDYGGARDVLNEQIVLDGLTYSIVGVMPERFGFPDHEPTVWVPMGTDDGLPWDDRASSFGARPIGRLAAGMTVAAAQQDMDRITRGIEEEAGRPVASTHVYTLSEHVRGSARTPALLLMGAVAFVLLIAGANVANLLLARGEDRRRELAVRKALGAGRRDIARQLAVESLLLALAGTLAGVILATAGVSLIRTWVPLPPLIARFVGIDGVVLLFTAALGALVGIVFGVVPALRAAGTHAGGALRAGGRGLVGAGGQRVRAALVVTEVALALVLVVGSGLMLATLNRLRTTDAGFDAAHLITARVTPSLVANPSRERWLGFYDGVLERLQAETGVQSAAAMLLVPLARRSWERLVQPEGVPFDPREGESVLYNVVTTDYFRTLDVAVVRGREFNDRDTNESPPVTIIDDTMAEMFWPGEDPIGKRIAFEQAETSTPDNPVPVYRTVVGVVRNVRHYELRSAARMQAYVSFHQALRHWGSALFVAVRTRPGAGEFAERLRSIVHDVDRNAPVAAIRSVESYIADDLAEERALGGLLSAFGLLALGLAGVGVFGVMSLLVGARLPEIGLRMAVGARPVQVLRMVLGRTLLLAGAGAVLGLVAAASLSRLMRAFLYQIGPLDLRVYAGSAAFLLVIAGGAALAPALRAARVDPVSTLRQET